MMAADKKTQAFHVTPLAAYLGVAAALLLLTGITVSVSFIDFGPWNMVVALAIAGVKMTLVALIFMHLYRDNKLYFVIFVTAILILVIFIMSTMFDTMRRDAIYDERARPIKPSVAYYDSPLDTTTQTDSTLGADSTGGDQ